MQQLNLDYSGEQDRLCALRELESLNALPDSALSRLTEIAQNLLQTPIILLSFIDRDRQWIKSASGLQIHNIPRNISLCNHTISMDRPLVIPDTHKEQKFCQNPMVTGQPYIRFYAGTPLITPGGHKIGTLCALDTQPRPPLSAQQITQLEGLAAMAMDQIMLTKRCHDAENNNDHKSRFLSYICHEMRTPLSVLFGSLDVFHHSASLTRKQKKLLETMQVASSSLFNLVDDFLDLSKIQNDNFKLQNSQIQYENVFHDIYKLLAHSAHKKQLSFEMDIDHLTGLTGWGDETRFRQIIINLVSNAIKFTSEGNITVKAGLEYSADNRPLFICTVSDTGIGIPKNQINKLFENYFQVHHHPDQDAPQGTGLGLAISKKLAEAMGGYLSCISAEGQGSTFILTLPHTESRQMSSPAPPRAKTGSFAR